MPCFSSHSARRADLASPDTREKSIITRSSSSLRLFVAAYPPRETAEALRRRVEELALPAHRLTPVEQIHLTLHFIGDTSPRDVAAAEESVMRAASGLREMELTVQRLITLPRRGPARLVAAEADAPPGLRELHDRLVLRFARAARQRPSDRFLPHLTLCRFRAPTSIPPLDAPPPELPFVVHEIKLMRSRLGPGGAHHEAIATAPLQPR